MVETPDSELRTQASHYAEKYGKRADQLEAGLEFYSLHLLAQDPVFADELLGGDPTESADLGEFHCGGSNDLGIDGILFNPSSSEVAIIQATWRSKMTDDLIAKASTFFNGLLQWSDHAVVQTANDETRALLNEIDLTVGHQRTTLYFVSNLATGENSKLRAAADDAKSKYEALGWDVDIVIMGVAELANKHAEYENSRDGGLAEDITFDIPRDRHFVVQEPHRVLVTAIKGNAISEIYNRAGVRNKLFNQNIRLALTGRLNSEIGNTAKDPGQAENFFYFNNGITATCSSFTLTRGNEVRAMNLQVVNGAQTVNQLARVLKKTDQNSKVYVMFRLIETGENYTKKTDLADRITKFQNTQNPVKASDFYSNDPIQEWLSRELSAKVSGRGATAQFYYQHKRGYRPAVRSGGPITIEQLAQMRHSLLYGPATSYDSPRSFWDAERVVYWQAFGNEGKLATFWPEEDLWKMAWAITVTEDLKATAKVMREKARKSGVSGNLESTYLQYLARYVMALVGQGVEALIAESKVESFKELMSSRKTFERYMKPLTKFVRQSVLTEVRTRQESEEANPKFYLSRDEVKFKSLSATLLESMSSDLIEF
ncbi:MAG TPA: AIPR family protein [Galbitalea sp.]|jgi:hypothetical protein|nr:AIPR family protein [Galbitalea sp.]